MESFPSAHIIACDQITIKTKGLEDQVTIKSDIVAKVLLYVNTRTSE